MSSYTPAASPSAWTPALEVSCPTLRAAARSLSSSSRPKTSRRRAHGCVPRTCRSADRIEEPGATAEEEASQLGLPWRRLVALCQVGRRAGRRDKCLRHSGTNAAPRRPIAAPGGLRQGDPRRCCTQLPPATPRLPLPACTHKLPQSVLQPVRRPTAHPARRARLLLWLALGEGPPVGCGKGLSSRPQGRAVGERLGLTSKPRSSRL